LNVTSPNTFNSNIDAFSITCSPGADFSGRWYFNFGFTDLTQAGNTVSGNYFNMIENAWGSITASISGSTLSGNYSLGSGTGNFSWSLLPGNNTFEGNWDTFYKWCGARAETFFPNNCSFQGTWYSNVEGLPPNCAMDLKIKYTVAGEGSITGSYCQGTINGNIFRNTSDIYTSESGAILQPDLQDNIFSFIQILIRQQNFRDITQLMAIRYL
jgi:hypothetical protein